MIRFLSDAPLGRCCTFLTGGRAKRLGFAYDLSELIEAANSGALVLGRGSNVLIGDLGYEGDVVINRTSAKEFAESSCTCDSGVLLSTLAREYRERGLTGLEWAYGLPGTVGGAVIGNAGAFGGCMAESVVCVETLQNGKEKTLGADECGFGYRHSSVAGTVTRVTLKAQSGDKEQIVRKCEENLRLRRSKQPIGASAGSVFKAAGDVSAAKYIDECGLKGLTVGGAQISDKHANFIINRGGAESADVLALINIMRAEVYDKFGVKLEREVKFYGEFF